MLDVHGVTGSSPVLSTIKLNQKRYQREKPRSFNDFRVFLRPIFEVEEKISKRVLAKSVDLNLYPRHFEPLFREFFGKAARFCSRKNVEFRPTFLVALPNTHSKHRCRRVGPLCGISDVKTAGIIPMESNRQTSPRIKGRHLKENCCSPRWRSIILQHIAFFRGICGKQLFSPCGIRFTQLRRVLQEP